VGISRSDTPQPRLGRKLLRKRLSPHGRSGKRRAASRNQRNWFAAIAGVMTWLRVLSSGGIADAASVSVNDMEQRHPSGRRRLRRNSLATSCDRGGLERARPFSSKAFVRGEALRRPFTLQVGRDRMRPLRFGFHRRSEVAGGPLSTRRTDFQLPVNFCNCRSTQPVVETC